MKHQFLTLKFVSLFSLISVLLWGASSSALAQKKISADLMAKAEEITNGQCFICHGLNGESSSPLYPRLAGQHAEYLVKQLKNFQSGVRQSDTMKPQVSDLSPEIMVAVGLYYENKSMPTNDNINPVLAGAGRLLFEQGNTFSGVPACMVCHGAQGLGTAQLPRLAGQRALYTLNQLKNFNKRIRTNDNEVMHSIASKLTEQEMNAVAEYIAGMK